MIRPRSRRRHRRPIALLAAVLLPLAAQGASDRIFADGFESCCRIGGTVSGLAGSGLVLHLAAGAIAEDRPIGHDGLYDFHARVPMGAGYTLGISAQPSGQTCALTISGGTVHGNVDTADVACAAGANLVWDSGHWGQDWN